MLADYVIAHPRASKGVLAVLYLVAMSSYLLLGYGSIQERLFTVLLSPLLCVLTFGAYGFVLRVQTINPYFSRPLTIRFCDFIAYGSVSGMIASLPAILARFDSRILLVPALEASLVGAAYWKRRLIADGTQTLAAEARRTRYRLQDIPSVIDNALWELAEDYRKRVGPDTVMS